MKKFIISMAVIFSLLTTVTFASGKLPVNEKVMQAFKKEFSNASNATWSIIEAGLYRVTFTYNNITADAYFDGEGTLVATGRDINENQLPLVVSKALNSKYAGADVQHVIEYTFNNETEYLITLGTDRGTQIIKASAGGDLQLFKKIKN